MPIIKQLSPHEIRKIAAGEVIERPVHVVKELLENALDAGAQKITLSIENGGSSYIELTDDGCGMDPEDARLCCLPHTTSKITGLDDLQNITTFGFRGEALASIATVSTLTLTTRTAQEIAGTRITVHYGETPVIAPCASATGTTVRVTNLFGNIPARKKFLKSHQTETGHIIQLFKAVCLSHPSLHATLVVDGVTHTTCPPIPRNSLRVPQLWDRVSPEHLLELHTTTATPEPVIISGYCSNHQINRYNRSDIFIFVNRRWVRNNKLVSAIINGYQNVLPVGKFPLACITVDVDPALIDVNIHPKKEEILFVHAHRVERAVRDAIADRLAAQVLPPTQTYMQPLSQPLFQPISHSLPPHPSQAVKSIHTQQFSVSPSIRPAQIPDDYGLDLFQEFFTQNNSENSTESTDIITEVPPYKIIGQLHATYIIIERPEGLCLIDQHAAHERILYELLSRQAQDSVAPIRLLFPQIITLTLEQAHALEQHIVLFRSYGVELDILNNTQFIVSALAAPFKNAAIQDLISNLAQWLVDHIQYPPAELYKQLTHELCARMACTAAVKAGDILTLEQITQLAADLHTTPNRFSCPHGRPTSWVLTINEIEKLFQRV